MTQEEKELLMKDLCARLPYGVKGRYNNTVFSLRMIDPFDNYHPLYCVTESGSEYIGIEEFKPYLFPLSSMTEEQKQEYTYIVNYISPDDTDNWKEGEFIYVEQLTQLMHFYHINHLDYMGLIPMGLANDATGLNIY